MVARPNLESSRSYSTELCWIVWSTSDFVYIAKLIVFCITYVEIQCCNVDDKKSTSVAPSSNQQSSIVTCKNGKHIEILELVVCLQLQVPMDIPSHPNSPRYRFEIASTISENFGENNVGILIVGDNATGRYCVEKRLRPADIAYGSAQREIEIMMQLRNHPNIIQLVDFELKDDPKLPECELSARTWTEYCETGNLLLLVDYLKTSEQKIPEPLLWHILRSLAEAVRYLQQGPKESSGTLWNMVYHRDIHLANIFLSSEPRSSLPRVVLGDFGLSTTTAHIKSGYNDEGKTSLFEQYFAPPEFPVYYPKSDVYQIGAVLYCLMYGQYRPYDGKAPRLVDGKRNWLEYSVWMREMQSELPYSDALVGIVSTCLRGDAFSRCDVVQLMSMLEKV
jgi:serine/threonine protein kinase